MRELWDHPLERVSVCRDGYRVTTPYGTLFYAATERRHMAQDPTDVHPEYDHPNPDNLDAWSEDQIEEYNRRKDADLEADHQQHRAELTQKQKETVDVLKSTTQPDEPLTETVSLGDAEVLVSKRLSGRVEECFDAITDEQTKEPEGEDPPRLRNVKGEMITAITELIVDDDEPEGDPYDFQSRATWEAYYYDEGIEGLEQVFNAIAGPALDRYETLGNSRGRTRRSGSGR